MSQADDLVSYADALIGHAYYSSQKWGGGVAWYNTATLLAHARAAGITDPLCSDCSGLVYACFRRAGVPWRTGGIWPRLSAQGYSDASVVTTDAPQIGDVYCHALNPPNNDVHHIVLVTGSNTTVESIGPVTQRNIDDPVHGVVARGLIHRRFPWVNLGTATATEPAGIRHGVDYAGAESSSSDWKIFFSELKAMGGDFIVRYLGTGWIHKTSISATELAAAQAAGVDVCFFWESSTTRAYGGSAAGQADAASALSYLTGTLGVAASTPVYYCLDLDYWRGQQNGVSGKTAASQYFSGIISYLNAHGLGVAQVGVYAGHEMGDWLLNNGLATYFCQANAWNYSGGWSSQAHIRQHGWVLAQTKIDGITCNRDSTNGAANFGQIGGGSTTSGTHTTPIPQNIVTYTPQLGSLGIGGILSDDDLVLMLKDTTGALIEFRGQVWDKQGGLAPVVTCRDQSAFWDRVPINLTVGDTTTIGGIVKACVGTLKLNGHELFKTDIEETLTESGAPITVSAWSGLGQTLSTVLSDLQTVSGARWSIESAGTGKELIFHWGDPANWDPYSVTIRDDIDFSAESSSQWRVLDPGGEINVVRDNSGYANTVNYTAVGTVLPAPSTPGGTWDEVWTESTSSWHIYNPVQVLISTDPNLVPQWGLGSNSIRFDMAVIANAWAGMTYLDLGYVTVPSLYTDMSSAAWANLYAASKLRLVGGGQVLDDIPGSVTLYIIPHSGSDRGPSSRWAPMISPQSSYKALDAEVAMTWQLYGNSGFQDVTDPTTGAVMFTPTSVSYLQFRVGLNLSPGTYTMTIWLDQMQPTQSSITNPTTTQQTTTTGSVQSAAVQSGSETPITADLPQTTLEPADAATLATRYLSMINRTRVTVPQVTLAGMRTVPLFGYTIPLNLTRVGVTGVSYPVVEADWAWGEAGNTTTLMLGDTPLNQLRLLEGLRHHLDRIGKGG